MAEHEAGAAAARGWTGPHRSAVARFLDVRRGEWVTTSLLVFAAFAVISSYYFLKPVSKSLFIATHGPEAQRFVYLWAAAGTGLVGLMYAWAARRVRMVPLLNGLYVTLALAVVAFRVALWTFEDRGILSYAFYVYVAAYGVLATAPFWLAVNHLFEPRQARRLIGYVGAGAIAGGIAGGFIVSGIVKIVGSDNVIWGGPVLLLVALGALDVCFLRGRPIPAHRPLPKARGKTPMSLIAETPYLRLLAGLIGVTMICSNLADYAFTSAVDKFVGKGDVATAYIAFWGSMVSVISLPTQVLVTSPVLRRFGVGPALLMLPCAMFMLATGMAVHPSLFFGTGLKLGDGALRYSVNKSALELLYLPLPMWLKDRTKVFLDSVVDRVAGKGGASIVLMILLDVFGLVEIQWAAAAMAVLAAIWAGWSLLLRRRYVDEFRVALDRGEVSLSSQRVRLNDPAAFRAIEGQLARHEAAAQRQAMDLLLDDEDLDVGPLSKRLTALVASPDPTVAARALLLASRAPSDDVVRIARQRLHDEDLDVAAAAARVLHAHGRDSAELLKAHAGDATLTAHVAGAILARGEDLPEPLVQQLLQDGSPAGARARTQLALAILRGDLKQRRPLLRRLMADPDPDVARTALGGSGKLGDSSLIPFLVSALRLPTTRAAARTALSDLGAQALAALDAYLWDPKVEHSVRRRIPRAIGQMGTLPAHEVLVRALSLDDPTLRHQVLKALNRMAQADPAMHVPPDVLESEIVAECHYLARLLALVSEPGGGGRYRKLFERAVAESLRHARERAFRLLGLRGRGRDWENAFAGLDGDDARLRASAIEFADSTLPDKLRRVVVPLIEDVGASEALHRVSRHLEVAAMSAPRAYVTAATGSDRWLAACALLAAAEEKVAEIDDVVQSRLADDDPMIREAAVQAASTLAG